MQFELEVAEVEAWEFRSLHPPEIQMSVYVATEANNMDVRSCSPNASIPCHNRTRFPLPS